MRLSFFRAFGAVTLFFSLTGLYVFVSAVISAGSASPQEIKMLVGFGFATVVGVGLLFLRRWAAIYFSVPLFYYGVRLALGSVEQFPFPMNLFWMCEGVSLMLPLLVTIRVWPLLSSGGKWFF